MMMMVTMIVRTGYLTPSVPARRRRGIEMLRGLRCSADDDDDAGHVCLCYVRQVTMSETRRVHLPFGIGSAMGILADADADVNANVQAEWCWGRSSDSGRTTRTGSAGSGADLRTELMA